MATIVSFGGAAARRAVLTAELDRLVPALCALPGVAEAWVFGSAAGGQVHATSDLDLFVVRVTDEPVSERAVTLLRELTPRVPVDLFVYTPDEAAAGGRFVRSVRATGRRLR